MAGEKILIVEDDALLQKMYQTIMSNAGLEVVLASDGEEGLSLARKEQPAVVMMDVMMPKMNGLQVLDELKRDKTTAGIPVIVLTGLSKVNEEKDVLARGASMYLDKSDYDPHRVVRLVQDVIAKKAQTTVPMQVPQASQGQVAQQVPTTEAVAGQASGAVVPTVTEQEKPKQ